jgi:hypothetical protein
MSQKKLECLFLSAFPAQLNVYGAKALFYKTLRIHNIRAS